MRIFEIPLTPVPQRFSIPLGLVTYVLGFRWRDTGGWKQGVGTWVLDIDDTRDNPLVYGIPLVTGADLLAQYEYLGFDVLLWVVTEGSDAPPTFGGLGIDSHLYYGVPTADERQQLRSPGLAATPNRRFRSLANAP